MNIQINNPSLSTHKMSLSVVFGLSFLYTMMQDSFEKKGRIKAGMPIEWKFEPLIPNPEASPGKNVVAFVLIWLVL